MTLGEHAILTLWLPEAMNERYRVSVAAVTELEGRANYTNFRRFDADTSISIR